jgi:hypothetical protein
MYAERPKGQARDGPCAGANQKRRSRAKLASAELLTHEKFDDGESRQLLGLIVNIYSS